MGTLPTILEPRAHPTSGLGKLRWAEWQGNDGTIGAGDASLSPDGVSCSMTIYIFWEDLNEFLTAVLGYSQRLNFKDRPSILTRKLPWQHPYWNQLFVKRVSSVKGLQLRGQSQANPVDLFEPARGGVGAGYDQNFGPWTEFSYALLTLQFWRPPYYVLSDAAIMDANSYQQEWMRYVTFQESQSGQMLSREGQTFKYTDGQGIEAGRQFVGSVGQAVMKGELLLHWHELPQAAIFETGADGFPMGLPANLNYMRTGTRNPITGYPQFGPGPNGQFRDPTTFVANGPPLTFTVNSPRDGGVDDSDPAKRFFGYPMGTLAYKRREIIPRDLQLPPYLMLIPQIAQNVAIAQQQFDVKFTFGFFDPPRSPAVRGNMNLTAAGAFITQACRGHNLMPYSGDGLWYAVQSQGRVLGGNDDLPPTTPFQYGVFHDLFQIV